MSGDPHQYRDFLIPPYANLRVKTDALYELTTFTPKEVAFDLLDNLATTHTFEFKHPALRKIEVQGVRSFAFEAGSRSRFRLQHEGAPQVRMAAGHHILSLQTSAHGVARLTRADVRSGKESEETFLITDCDLQVEFAAAFAGVAREHA